MRRDESGRVAVTFEVVYALAWRASPPRADGRASVRFDPSRRRTR
jgi:hypothetical protein